MKNIKASAEFSPRRREASRSGALAAAGLLTALTACAPRGVEFFVSPAGNDAWSGHHPAANRTKSDGPFATLERARDAVRESRRRGAARRPVTVHIRGGTYCITNTLVFAAEDRGTKSAPVVYRAFEGERPVLVGGLPIVGFAAHRGGIVKADVRAQGFAGAAFRQLIFNGKRQHLARYPNFDAADPVAGGWACVDGAPVAMHRDLPGDSRREFVFRACDARAWSHPEEGEVFVFPRYNWWNDIIRIASADPTGRKIVLARDASHAIRPGDRYFVRGLLEELDAPGEWYLDAKAGTLYFLPPSPVGSGAVYAPRVGNIVVFDNGAAHIALRGLTLECCEESAVVVRNAEHCLIAGCTIRNVGGYHGSGVWVAGGRDNGVAGCDISDTGSHGIALGSGDLKTLSPAGNFAENNHITCTGTSYKQGAGIHLDGVGNRASRNTIHHVPRWCIGFRGAAHLIELNHLHHACLETDETGAICGGSRHWLSGHRVLIRHNLIHDTIGFGRHHATGAWTSPHSAWGIYLDWGAAGVAIRGNIVARAPRAGIMLHDGRDNRVENNIVVDCAQQQIECAGWTTNTPCWTHELDGWIAQYESVRGVPAWHDGENTLRDPRKTPLPDGRTMRQNSFQRNILACGPPDSRAFLFRNVSPTDNPSNRNLVWSGGRPVRTGEIRAAGSIGPNLAPNPGFELGTPGQLPEQWTWHVRTRTADEAYSVRTNAIAGALCLRFHRAPDDPAPAIKPAPDSMPSFKCADVPASPGKAYRIIAWLRAARPDTPVEIGAQSLLGDAPPWVKTKIVTVGTSWSEHEFAFLFAGPDNEAARPGLGKFHVRLRLPNPDSEVWVDDVRLNEAALMDEWQAWLALGMDRNSVIGDPLFLDAAHDDFRLRAQSPALALGFEPIPIERIGCHPDVGRASWPLESTPPEKSP